MVWSGSEQDSCKQPYSDFTKHQSGLEGGGTKVQWMSGSSQSSRYTAHSLIVPRSEAEPLDQNHESGPALRMVIVMKGVV